MDPFLVVHAVALRTLDDVAQPTRSRDVPVIEELRQPGEQHGSGRGADVQSHDQVQHGARKEAVQGHLERVLVEARHHLQTARSMMNVMDVSPEERHGVPRTMPPVVDERDDAVAQERTPHVGETVRDRRSMFQEPRVPRHVAHEHHPDLHRVQQQCPPPPARDGRPGPLGCGQLPGDHQGSDADDDEDHGPTIRPPRGEITSIEVIPSISLAYRIREPSPRSDRSRRISASFQRNPAGCPGWRLTSSPRARGERRPSRARSRPMMRSHTGSVPARAASSPAQRTPRRTTRRRRSCPR